MGAPMRSSAETDDINKERKSMSSMKERMHSGELYLPGDEDIMKEQFCCLEKLYDYKLSHGECVIKGMYYAIKSSYSLGFMTEEAKNKAVKFLSLSGVSDGCDFTIEQILSVMKSDKKADGDEVNFVFTSGFSKAFIKKVSLKTVLGSL